MIKLDPDTGIKNVKELHAALLDEFKNNDEVIIDFSEVERIDLSVAQLVIASGREARSRGKTTKLKAVPRSVKYQLQICGLKI
jgi:anti-anti-sigma regulatory factor